MSPALVEPPRPDETWTLTDLAETAGSWSASRRGVTDSDGVTWVVTGDSGWHDGPDVALAATKQPRGDGGRLGPQWRTPRTVVLSGRAFMPASARSVVTIDAARRAWLGLCAEGPRTGSLAAVAADGVGERLPFVVVSDQPKAGVIVSAGWERRFAWQITVTAADPLKYSSDDLPQTCGLPAPGGGLVYPLTYPLDYHTPVANGQVSIVNRGTATTWPKLLLTAPFDNPTVSDPDAGNSLTIALVDPTVGDYLLIDTHPARRRVLLNGVASRRGQVRVTGDWVPCAPGTTRLRYRASTFSASTMTAIAPSASW